MLCVWPAIDVRLTNEWKCAIGWVLNMCVCICVLWAVLHHINQTNIHKKFFHFKLKKLTKDQRDYKIKFHLPFSLHWKIANWQEYWLNKPFLQITGTDTIAGWIPAGFSNLVPKQRNAINLLTKRSTEELIELTQPTRLPRQKIPIERLFAMLWEKEHVARYHWFVGSYDSSA